MKNIVQFIKEHYPLAIVTVAIGFIFTHLEKFAEFGYGALRLGVVILVAFGLISLVFKSTIRPYIHDGLLVNDWNGLTGQKRLYICFAVIAFIIYVALQCFVHP